MCSQTDDPSENDWGRGMFLPQKGSEPMHEEHERRATTADTPASALEAVFLDEIKVMPGQRGGPTQSWWEDQVAMLEAHGYALVPLSGALTARELADQHDIMVRHLAEVARR